MDGLTRRRFLAQGVAASAATVVLTAYLVPYGLLQPVCGTLGDRFGRQRVLNG